MRGCRSLNDSEIESVKLHLNNTRDYTLFVLGLFTGYRIAELLSIQVKDTFQYGSIVSHLTVSRKNMKGSKSSRTVKLHSEAQHNILKLINEHNLTSEDYLFQSRKGINQPISTVQAYRILKAAFRACKLQGKIATHSMRKTLAKRLYEASGHNVLVVQKGLGHKSLSSTTSYLDCDSDMVDDLISSL